MDAEQYGEIREALGRIEAGLNTVQAEGHDTKVYVRDVSRRVRSLEVSRGRILGWASGIGALFGGIGAWLMGYFNNG